MNTNELRRLLVSRVIDRVSHVVALSPRAVETIERAVVDALTEWKRATIEENGLASGDSDDN